MKKYYQLLKKNFKEKESVLTEIINLEAISNLPKGTEHFVSDIHGEYGSFDHVMRTGSGSIREKVKEVFLDHPLNQIDELCELIYYPERTIVKQISKRNTQEINNWYISNLLTLLPIVKKTGQKYTRSKVRKALSPQFSYIIEELLNEIDNLEAKQAYFDAIIMKLIELEQMDDLMISLCYTIQRLSVDHLHVVGDIYDRGPKPDDIMDTLMAHHSVDIQWGNHDIIWLATLAGSPQAMINVIRICARYGNLSIIEDSYGINIRPLIDFATAHYPPTRNFAPHLDDKTLPELAKEQANSVQQACAIIQFKLEEQLIQRRPEFLMNERQMLSNIDFTQKTIRINNQTYPLEHFNPITIDKNLPTQLTQQEDQLTRILLKNFQHSDRLRKHMNFLIEKGSMYLCYNDNLLYHGCIPLHSNGDFKSLHIEEKNYFGKALLDYYEKHVRFSYQHPDCSDDLSTDLLWYLWTGECSSLFGKKAMTTFERYYLTDKQTHKEEKNPYYELREREEICQRILKEFNLSTEGHIINGHTPVKEKTGESPIKANGKMLVIDGGYAKGYQKTTGVAGYTLLSNSYGIQIATHHPFSSIDDALTHQECYLSIRRLVETVDQRKTVKSTTIGKKIQEEINDLMYIFNHFEEL
ncbi:fructose-1,6-bisphosphatase [Vagococcus xieshaowenii]|uniref:Fructose-1,6-bisphosphatase class 3 n=1 Tax=Vagococcus xieshaowenii TaxID=2562451 RepID=A0AAJ5JLQ6_9ENTE|nr:fructose-1,6-bisphosphatase [Vagococcus xieshaowenii]QCA28455.1 fructose-1,6-bisphosphatase [Vagococcus xieshaowenii]TFZ42790.1 fructose-1,6-bisphosphatase [Vagococcus xieshaowenii]